MRILFTVCGFVCMLGAMSMLSLKAHAQTPDTYQALWRARVSEVLSRTTEFVPGTTITQPIHTVRADILEGERAGENIEVVDDHLALEEGDTFFLTYTRYSDGSEVFTATNRDRRGALIVLGLLFVVAVVLFGGVEGIRALFALCGGFLVILYVLLPGILGGWNPVLASILAASTILFGAIFFTHGFTRESFVAYGGTILAVGITGVFAHGAIHFTGLSGFTDDVSTYLHIHTNGMLDFGALLLGAIIIGALGVLDDIAVTQVAVVRELFDTNPALSKKDAYLRAHRVGRAHTSALINTLILAYASVSLPLLLYLTFSPMSASLIVSTEVVATEIVRAVVGSIGLILTMPIVTLLAVFFLKKRYGTLSV